MKTWFIALPFLCAVNLAQAADIEAAPAADKMESATAPVKAGAHHRMHKRAMKRLRPVNLPHGDLRYCLERKTNEAIIYCAEERRKR
jgi:hypothetical protein